MIEHKIEHDSYVNAKVMVKIHDTEVPNFEARLASALIERWGIVAAEPDGEDTAGRARLRRMRADEVVEHACVTADLAVAQFRERGWMVNLPTLADIDEFKKGIADK